MLTLAAGDGYASSQVALDLLAVLACAGLVALIFGRLRMAVIPAYLVAGAVIGPDAVGLIKDAEGIEGVASLSITLLMFGIGLHLDASALRHGAARIITAGIVSTGLSALLISVAALAFGLDTRDSIVVGLALSLSSTAVVLKLLQQRRELYTLSGRACLGILLTQDLLVLIMLAMMPVVAGGGMNAPTDGDSVMITVGQASTGIAGVLAILLVGKLALPKLMEMTSKWAGGEVLLVIAAAGGLGAAMLAGKVGLSPELGAFLAGFLLAGTPFRHQLSAQVSPLRDLFMALFFTSVGLRIDLGSILDGWWIVLIGTAALLLLKAVSIWFSAWLVGLPSRAAGRSGVWLAQGGEFSLVLLGVGQGLGMLEGSTGGLVVGVVAASLILTPSLVANASALAALIAFVPQAPWGRRGLEESVIEDGEPRSPEPERECPVLIAGFGPVGRACAERLEKAGVKISIVELNASTVRRQLQLGRRAVYGDASTLEVLEHAGLLEARAVLLTMPDQDAALRATKTVRSARPDVYLAVRAGVLGRAMEAIMLGADDAVADEVAAAEVMSRRVIEKLGEDPPPASDPAPVV